MRYWPLLIFPGWLIARSQRHVVEKGPVARPTPLRGRLVLVAGRLVIVVLRLFVSSVCGFYCYLLLLVLLFVFAHQLILLGHCC